MSKCKFVQAPPSLPPPHTHTHTHPAILPHPFPALLRPGRWCPEALAPAQSAAHQQTRPCLWWCSRRARNAGTNMQGQHVHTGTGAQRLGRDNITGWGGSNRGCWCVYLSGVFRSQLATARAVHTHSPTQLCFKQNNQLQDVQPLAERHSHTPPPLSPAPATTTPTAAAVPSALLQLTLQCDWPHSALDAVHQAAVGA